jgi:hypothetical protein
MKNILLLIAVTFISNSYSQTWQDVGGGTNNSSHGMVVWDNKLIDVGSFNNPCGKVAAWDGVSWSCLGGGVGIVGRAAAVWDGKLVVVGDFWNVFQPCVGCNGVAVWDGVSWTPLGNGVNNDVLSITVWNNEVVIAGDFTQADGVPVARIVRWDGSAWQSVGNIGDFTNDIRAMVEFEGELWAGGDFNNVGGNPPSDGLVKWDVSTSSWTGGNSGVDLVGGVNESVRVLYVNPNDGNLYMGGEFPELWDGDAPAQDFNMSGVAMYDGSNWTPLGTGLNEYVRAMHEYNGDLICGGYFTNAGGTPANKIAKWNPVTSTWSAMGLGFDGAGVDEYVKSAAVWNGIFFAGGAYTQAEGGPMNYISQWYEAPTTPPVAWMSSSATTICGGQCIDFLDNSTNAPTSWTWSFPGSSTPTSALQNPGTICYPTAGSFTASLQACNSFGCNTQNIDITVLGSATVTVNDASVCDGSPATLTAVPSSPGGDYLWSPGGETTASITVNPLVTTTYSVQYTTAGCGNATASGTVTVTTTPSVTVNSAGPICEGNSISLTATPSTGGGTYFWSPTSDVTATINPSPLATTNYTVEYTLNGCTSTPAATTVTVEPTPTIVVSNESICDGQSATLTSTPSIGGGTYLWSPGSEITPSITYSPAVTTSYSVVYTVNGCPSTSESGTITVTPTPTLTVNNETICLGNSATLIATPSSGGGTYDWSPGGELTPSISVSPLATTSYSVIYTLNGCPSSSASSTVTVEPTPTVTVNDQTICEGDMATLTATPSAGGGTYLWSPGGAATASITVSPASTTPYTVVYSLNGCSSIGSIGTVNVTPTPLITVDNASICEGESATLTATPATGGGTYLWSPGGAATASITVSPASTTPYTVVYTLNGCSSIGSIGTVNVTPTPLVTVDNASICEGESATLTATPATGGGTYVWTPGSEITSSITYSPAATTSYSVVYTLNGCASISETGTITVSPTPTITVNSETICVGNSVTLIATPSTGGGTYLWSPGGEVTASITPSPSITTSYSVVYTLNGCPSTSITANVTVLAGPDLTVTEAGNVLTASQVGANYQWLDCDDNYAQIVGETNQSYAPTSNGNYAVEVDLGGCLDTSSCALLTTIGLDELTQNNLSVYPNPASNELSIRSTESLDNVKYQIIDSRGKIVLVGTLNEAALVDVSMLTDGIYSLLLDKGLKGRIQFVKK